MRRAVWFLVLSLPAPVPRAAVAAFAGWHPAIWGNQTVCTGLTAQRWDEAEVKPQG